jgi:hypothetical protein
MDKSAPLNPDSQEEQMERQRICVRVADACKMLSIGRTTLFKLGIPYIKINSMRLYKVADLEAYLEAHMVIKEGV